MLKVVAHDPGLDGALASYSGTPESLFIMEMPAVKIKKHGRDIDYSEVLDHIETIFTPADHFFTELVNAMPNEGPSGAFKFGYVDGSIVGMFRAFRVPMTEVPASVWKPSMKVKSEKMTSVIRAMELFPNQTGLFKGPRGGHKDGCAEAALIAVYGWRFLSGIR